MVVAASRVTSDPDTPLQLDCGPRMGEADDEHGLALGEHDPRVGDAVAVRLEPGQPGVPTFRQPAVEAREVPRRSQRSDPGQVETFLPRQVEHALRAVHWPILGPPRSSHKNFEERLARLHLAPQASSRQRVARPGLERIPTTFPKRRG